MIYQTETITIKTKQNEKQNTSRNLRTGILLQHKSNDNFDYYCCNRYLRKRYLQPYFLNLNKTKMTQIKLNKEIIQHSIYLLESSDYEGIYGCDLHHELFNTDYYVIGYYESNKFIENYGGAWKAIYTIKNYEKEMFGEVSTDLSNCEKVANMIAYIEGELVLMESKTIEENWDNKLDEQSIIKIITELKELL